MNEVSKAILLCCALALVSGCGGSAPADPDPTTDPDPDPNPDPDPGTDPDPDPEPDPGPTPQLGTPGNPFAARGITATRAPDPALTPGAPRATVSGIDVTFDENDLFLFTFEEGYGTAADFLCNLNPNELSCTAVASAGIVSSSSTPAINGEYSAAMLLTVTFDDGSGTYVQTTPVFFETSQATAADVILPSGTVVYEGEAAGRGTAGTQTGQIAGTFELTSDFAGNSVDGTVVGSLANTVAIAGSFTGAVIDPATGSFAADGGTTYSFLGSSATGLVDGGFFGPNADEVAGALYLESATGNSSASLILLGTQTP